MSSFGTSPDRPTSISEPFGHLHSPSSSSGSSYSDDGNHNKGWKNKSRKKSASFACRIREHVRLGPKLSETLKGKLSLGARIIQEGGREKIFLQLFGVKEGEELMKASQCYLSTTAGPIAGILFISTQKVAFCSERPITLPSPSGALTRALYKVLIPAEKIKTANRSENVNKPEQKYLEITTKDGFEFWFMGFLRYEKAFSNLQKVISMFS